MSQISDKKLSISCFNVPDGLLDRKLAKDYFQRFGSVVRVRLRPKHRICIVQYENENDAHQAFFKSGIYEGKTFRIAWTKHKSSIKKKMENNEKNISDYSIDDPEVEAELNAMRGTVHRTSLHPEDVKKSSPRVTRNVYKNARSKKKGLDDSPKLTQLELKKMDQESSELVSSMMRPARTSEEKFRVLDARDKLIRTRVMRQSKLENANRTIGTCPDMCPEKERLMRDAQHQVAVYEQLSGTKGTLNHTIAVKQYSRSSADQETPLAHELRPVHVLQLTMGYLLHSIMVLNDLPDTNLAEWYHFVWDRTRGIRKDITQQELCCQGSVTLVEQCARFHIHCSARLVAEDVSVFDQRINTENLTKCLQTLKYLYNDLAMAQEVCANEAEFRAYIILLNLNDANFMWEVQQLRRDVQQSPEVQFALQVYTALDNNNYIRFFKLVRETTYLNACILLRYFNQVRYKALVTILKSYSPRQPYTQYPIDELTYQLAFEAASNTIDFLEFYGLQFMNNKQTHVLLDRRALIRPDVPFVLDRAVNVIESKRRHLSVGQIVCGNNGGLPERDFEAHVPFDSFDENGYLKLSEIPFEWRSKCQEQLTPELEAEPRVESNDEIEIDGDEEYEMEIESKQSPFTFALPSAAGFSFINTNQMIPEVTKTFTFQLPTTFVTTAEKSITYQEEENMEEDEQEEEEEGEKIKPTEMIFFKHLNEPVSIPQVPVPVPVENEIDLPAIAEPELEIEPEELIEELEEESDEDEELLRLQLLEQQKELERLEELSRMEELRKRSQIQKLNERIHSDVKQIVNELVETVEIHYRQTKLKQISDEIRKRKFLKFINKWRTVIRLKKRKRKSFFDTPVWIPVRGAVDEAQELCTPKQCALTLQDLKRYKSGKSINLQPPETEVMNTKLNVFKTVWKELFEQTCKNDSIRLDLYWKIGVSLRENCKRLNEIVTFIFDWNQNGMNVNKIGANNGGSLTYCIQKLKQPQNDLNGFILFITQTETFESVRKRFVSEHFPVPVSILIEETNTIDIEELEEYLKRNKYTEIKFFYYNFNQTGSSIFETVTDSLKWFSGFGIESVPLEMNTLDVCLRNCVGEEFLQRLRTSVSINQYIDLLFHGPNTVIDLYNEAIQYLENIFVNSELFSYPDFPAEFKRYLQPNKILPYSYEYFPSDWKFKSDSYQTKIKNVLKQMLLPRFEHDWPPSDLIQLHHQIRNYCAQIFGTSSTRIVYKLLSVPLKSLCNERMFQSRIKSISWFDIVQVLIEEKINSAPILNIVYNVKEMNHYRTNPWWYHSELIQGKIGCIDTNDPDDNCSDNESVINDDVVKEVIDETEKFLDDSFKVDNSKNLKDLNALSMLIDDLEQSMAIQKKIMSKFQENIERALK